MVSSVNLKELSKRNFGPRLYVIEFRLRITALLRKITHKYRIVLVDCTLNFSAQEFPGWVHNREQDVIQR